MKYRSAKGTVINIPDGLSEKQIKSIKADADAGYGTRAQETANKLKKGEGKKGGKKQKEPQIPTLGDAVDPKSGTVDPDKAADVIDEQKKEDVEEQFKLDHPLKMVDQYGNVRIITRDPNTGEITITDELGGTAKTFKDLAEAAAGTFQGDVSRAAAEEATYGTLTKYYDRDQAREMEAVKQEMAERGIPYDPAAAMDPSSKNLYGRTVGAVDQKYRALKDDAGRQAVLAGNQAYATDAAARDSFLNAVMSGAGQFSGSWGPYKNNIDATKTQEMMDLLNLSAEAYMAKYGIDQDTYIKKKALAQQNSGGGGGGGGSASGGGGFEITN